MSELDIEKLKYPIGNFVTPQNYSHDQRSKDISIIKDLPHKLKQTIYNLDDAQLDTPYRPGGWTVRQLVHHLADSHMNSFIRFKLTLTEDNPTIKPYDQAAWCDMEESKKLPVNASLNILSGVHERLTAMLNAMQEDDFTKKLYHPEMEKQLTLNRMLSLYSWHSEHHLAQIKGLIERKGW